MTLQLENKVIVITGAQGAAGSDATKMLLERGAFVAACDIRPVSDFRDFEKLKEQYGSDRLIYIQGNMTKEDQVQDLMRQIDRTFGRLNGCYHTAYVNNWGLIANQSLADWEDAIRGTLTSTFLVSKYAAELMIKSQGGSIVNVSSVLGTHPKKYNAAYGAGKAGVEHLTRVIAVEYAQYGIRANTVVPGDFKSVEVLANMSQQHHENMKRDSLAGRSGAAREINEVAAFLLSDAASYVTGSLYPATGGIWLSPDRNN